MQLNSRLINYVIGNEDIINNMKHVPAIQPFDKQVMNYLDAVAKILLNNIESKKYPDVITFAFWIRRASILNMKKSYVDISNRIGRGIAFHIAPSNVAVNFAYSLVTGLLSGNANVVRLPSKNFEQVELISEAFTEVMNENIKKYICLVQYEHNREITDYFSSLCDTRVIWGGDQTISTIRKSPIKPRTTEITFADRYSMCIINSEEYLKEMDKKSVAQGFYNDTYLSDQNACTSPRIVIWFGNSSKDAQDIFWNELYKIVEQKYQLQPVKVVNKYLSLCKQAANNKDIHYVRLKDNYIIRVKIDHITDDLMKFKGNSGYFMEYEAHTLEGLKPLCISQCQTLSFFGLDMNVISDFVINSGVKGIDRIVPIGKTMEFSLKWDGYDLIRSLSRDLVMI